jgi:D-glycero-D-manno-heptose 1,7-bisphosphate phosphatase
MPLFLLDRDGVLVVNRSDNVKTPDQMQFIPGAAEAIARLNRAGYQVGMCTNQPEVGRGAMTRQQLDRVHDGMRSMLTQKGATIEQILCSTTTTKCPSRKPAGSMLCECLRHFGANAADTAFVGDQADDLKAAFHAGCRPVLVKTGLGQKTLLEGLPKYLGFVEIHDDLASAVDAELERTSSLSS